MVVSRRAGWSSFTVSLSTCSGKLFVRAGGKQGQRRCPEPDWATLVVEMRKPAVTLQILWEEYRAVHPGGYGYSRFCELYRGFEGRLSPTMRQEHVAGDKIFVDYSGKEIAIADPRTREAVGGSIVAAFTYYVAHDPQSEIVHRAERGMS